MAANIFLKIFLESIFFFNILTSFGTKTVFKTNLKLEKIKKKTIMNFYTINKWFWNGERTGLTFFIAFGIRFVTFMSSIHTRFSPWIDKGKIRMCVCQTRLSWLWKRSGILRLLYYSSHYTDPRSLNPALRGFRLSGRFSQVYST